MYVLCVLCVGESECVVCVLGFLLCGREKEKKEESVWVVGCWLDSGGDRIYLI